MIQALQKLRTGPRGLVQTGFQEASSLHTPGTVAVMAGQDTEAHLKSRAYQVGGEVNDSAPEKLHGDAVGNHPYPSLLKHPAKIGSAVNMVHTTIIRGLICTSHI